MSTTPVVTAQTKLQKFEGFLKRAGHIGLVVLKDVVKFVVPAAQVAAVADPAIAPEINAFVTAESLVQNTVIAAEAKWASEPEGTTSEQKLADVLTICEQPVIALFAQAGVTVDADYVTNLINAVVSRLNLIPASALPAAA